jgi:hypothetical protein
MVQKKVVSGRKGIVHSNIWDEVISVLHIGEDCTLATDQFAPQWLLKLKKPGAKLSRWALQLFEFQNKVIHCPGKHPVVPDVPSGTSGTHRHNHCHIRARE